MSVDRSVRRSVGRSVTPYFFCIFELFEGRSEYFMGVNAPVQVSTAPALLITAPAQPPATGAVVYTALFLLFLLLYLFILTLHFPIWDDYNFASKEPKALLKLKLENSFLREVFFFFFLFFLFFLL